MLTHYSRRLISEDGGWMFKLYRWDKDIRNRMRGTFKVHKNGYRRVQVNMVFSENATGMCDKVVDKMLQAIQSEGIKVRLLRGGR